MDKLNIQNLKLLGAYTITPNTYEDERGSFSRVYCQKEFSKITDENFIQINHSKTIKKGTLRGMHFQYPPKAESKLVKCIKGSIIDVIVDIREDSKTFLQHHLEILSEENMKMIYIPKGFAHGFQTLEDNTEVLYFHSEFYEPENEGGLNPMDKLLNISWPLEITNISKKDEEYKLLDSSFKGIKVEL